MNNAEILKNGLWHNNPALMQLLGLCPLLAVSNTFVSGFTLGMATILVLVCSNSLIALLRKHIDYNLRIPFFMLIIASLVTCIIFFIKSLSFELYNTLGVYLALITTNCVILGRIEAFAYKNTVPKAILDGLANGLGFTIVLIILGCIREALGQGTLFANSSIIFGPLADSFVIHLNTTNNNFILALLPPGAFFILGLLIALKNYFTAKTIQHEQATKISDIRKIS